MSRIGKKPVPTPQGVKVVIAGRRVSVEGPKGRLELNLPYGIEAEYVESDGHVAVHRKGAGRQARAFHGLARSLIANMVVGCSEGYTRKLELHGIGYNLKLDGEDVLVQAGYCHPVRVSVPEGVTVTIEQPTNPGLMTVSGCDKQLVGQTAARLRAACPPEPYQGKGVRYANEQIRRKAGKAFAATAG